MQAQTEASPTRSADSIDPLIKGEDDNSSEKRLTSRVARCPQGTSDPVVSEEGGVTTGRGSLERRRRRTPEARQSRC